MDGSREASTSALPPSKPLPFFPRAAQPEIVRAQQKDAYYLSSLHTQLEDVARSFLGTRWLQRWGDELGMGSKAAYFALTTLVGTQTLGEEYVDVMMYDGKTRRTLTQRKRAILGVLGIVLPYALSRLFVLLRRTLAPYSSTPTSSDVPATARERALRALAKVMAVLPAFETIREDYLRSVHLALFYLAGRYYTLSKRFTGTRYISTLNRAPSSQGMSSYEVLGALMAAQLAVRGALSVRKWRASAVSSSEVDDASLAAEKEHEKVESNSSKKKRPFTIDGLPISQARFDPDDPEDAAPFVPAVIVAPNGEQEEEDEEDLPQERRCPLCLGGRRDPTATECGHVFCWECVVGWAREKGECPLCRQRVELGKLLPLYNL